MGRQILELGRQLSESLLRLEGVFNGASALDYSLVPQPYCGWLMQRPDILRGDYAYTPGRPVDRSPQREIAATQAYFAWMNKQFPEYMELIEYVIRNPVSLTREEGIAGVKMIGRRDLSPMEHQCRVAVVIPAKDEENSIYQTLELYSKQQTQEGKPLDPRLYELDILVNTREGEDFDRTYDEIMRFKNDYPQIHVNALEVEFQKSWAKVGLARKLMSDIVLARSLQRKVFYRTPLYLQSDDADLIWVDPRQIRTVIDTFDQQPHLDTLTGYQEKFLPYIANFEFIFLSRRFWDLMTAQANHYLHQGRIAPKDRDFHWSRPFTYGTNTAITAEAYALIGGYDWDSAVGEDLDLGRRVSLLRGRVVNGTFTPELSTIGIIRTRTNSSPRRYLWSLIKETGNPYSEGNFQNSEVRKLSMDDMAKAIPPQYLRLTKDNKGIYEKELWFLYETTRRIIPDRELAKLITRRALVLMGFHPQDIEVTDSEVHILNVDNFSKAMEDYRQRKGIKI